MGALRALLRRLRPGSLERGDHAEAADEPLDNLDAMASSHFGELDDDGSPGVGLPSSWVNSYDEGRPRK